jgi:hypothetical protein
MRYKVAAIGLPGTLSGGIYGNLMKNVSRLTQPGDYYAGGLDYG